ncbi:MAG: tRNA adenosine(34) deaminase TadA [Eubacteriales bacterium]|jgi:tRNA(adenine34) deaminase|nr:nucleoside deaminase [Clostridiales bacterium]
MSKEEKNSGIVTPDGPQKDEIFMRAAISEAVAALDEGEVPIGCVIVRDGKIIAAAHNKREKEKNALYHAEILAIDKACHALGGWRLPGCTLYVTLEPCPMCAGAIVSARIERVVYGAKDPKAGAFGSVLNLNSYPLNHKPEIISGVLKRDCADMLSQFFAKKRENYL